MSATRATATRQAQLDECDETQFAAATLAAAGDAIGSGDDEAIVTPLASHPEAAKARILELRAAIRRAA